jgi:GNAT superfamily N-acetyltransferase
MLEDLARRWQRGWSSARGWTEYSDDGDVIAVTIGEPDRAVEYICTDVNQKEAIRRLHSNGHPPHACRINVFTQDSTTVQPQDLEVLRISPVMVINLADQRAVAPKYRVDVRTKGPVIEAKVSTAREVLSRGLMAVAGKTAVADSVQTHPAHRRRGLAAAVMHELVATARLLGATDGVLMASTDGRHLYRELGWVVAADIVVVKGKREELVELVERARGDQ